jgi:hypothetical protein
LIKNALCHLISFSVFWANILAVFIFYQETRSQPIFRHIELSKLKAILEIKGHNRPKFATQQKESCELVLSICFEYRIFSVSIILSQLSGLLVSYNSSFQPELPELILIQNMEAVKERVNMIGAIVL